MVSWWNLIKSPGFLFITTLWQKQIWNTIDIPDWLSFFPFPDWSGKTFPCKSSKVYLVVSPKVYESVCSRRTGQHLLADVYVYICFCIYFHFGMELPYILKQQDVQYIWTVVTSVYCSLMHDIFYFLSRKQDIIVRGYLPFITMLSLFLWCLSFSGSKSQEVRQILCLYDLNP